MKVGLPPAQLVIWAHLCPVTRVQWLLPGDDTLYTKCTQTPQVASGPCPPASGSDNILPTSETRGGKDEDKGLRPLSLGWFPVLSLFPGYSWELRMAFLLSVPPWPSVPCAVPHLCWLTCEGDDDWISGNTWKLKCWWFHHLTHTQKWSHHLIHHALKSLFGLGADTSKKRITIVDDIKQRLFFYCWGKFDLVLEQY